MEVFWVDGLVGRERFADSVLEKEVVGQLHALLGRDLRCESEGGQEALVLGLELVVEDLALAPELVGSAVHQWFEGSVLVGLAVANVLGQ